MEEVDGKLCTTLEMGILAGVAFHHSGLTADERQIIESAFQVNVFRECKRLVTTVCATDMEQL
uniref:Antitermination protein n=1 Tax=Ascaris lumbricoides TaxID=6252 RepID=A0A0M3HI73_ASCLU